MGQSLSRLLIHDSIQTLGESWWPPWYRKAARVGDDLLPRDTKGRELEGPPIQQQEKGKRKAQANVVVEEIPVNTFTWLRG